MLTDTGKVLNGAGLEISSGHAQSEIFIGHPQFARVWYLVDIHVQMASKHLDT